MSKAKALAAVVRDYVSRKLDPVSERVKAIENRPIPQNGEQGPPGRDGAPGLSAFDIAVERGFIGTHASWLESLKGVAGRDGVDGRDGAAGRDGVDGAPGLQGKDADQAVIAAAVAEGIAKALPAAVERALSTLLPDIIAKAAAAVPRPRDGVDGAPGKDAPPIDEAEIVASLTEKLLRAVDALPKPKDGRDGRDAPEVDLDAVVAKVVPLIPRARDGVDGKDGAPGTNGNDGRDGVNGKDAPAVDVEALIETVVKRLPSVRDGIDGKDGVDGHSVTLDDVRPVLEAETARWQLEFERRAGDMLRDVIEKMPAPRDGRDGVDGRDALSVEDFEVRLHGRVFTFALRCGDRVVEKQIKVPFPLDKGLYRSGSGYEQGDVVTFGGSQWIAQRDTATSPPSDDWRLCVKKGKDGKGSA